MFLFQFASVQELRKRQTASGRAASSQKWPADHAVYKEKHNIAEKDLQVPQVRWVHQCSGLSIRVVHEPQIEAFLLHKACRSWICQKEK